MVPSDLFLSAITVGEIELGIEKEPAGTDGEHVGVVAHHDECAAIGQENALESVAQWLSGSNERKGPGHGRNGSLHEGMVPVSYGRLRPVCALRREALPGDRAVTGTGESESGGLGH